MPEFSRNAQLISGSLLYRISPKSVNKYKSHLHPHLLYRQLSHTAVYKTLLYRNSWHSDKQFSGWYGVVHRRAWSAHQALLITVWRTPDTCAYLTSQWMTLIPILFGRLSWSWRHTSQSCPQRRHVTARVVTGHEDDGVLTAVSLDLPTDRWLLGAGAVVTGSHIAQNLQTKIWGREGIRSYVLCVRQQFLLFCAPLC
jgi:hypothetical protein